MLKYILLGFLSYGAKTGYQLKTLIDGSTAHFWHAFHSQIYTTLRALERDGLVRSDEDAAAEDKLNRRVYQLTEAGRDALTAWLAVPLAGTVEAKEDLLVRVFFSGGRPRNELLDELRVQRSLHQAKLRVYEHITAVGIEHEHQLGAAERADLPFWTATLRFGLMYEQMYLAWLNETLAALESTE